MVITNDIVLLLLLLLLLSLLFIVVVVVASLLFKYDLRIGHCQSWHQVISSWLHGA